MGGKTTPISYLPAPDNSQSFLTTPTFKQIPVGMVNAPQQLAVVRKVWKGQFASPCLIILRHSLFLGYLNRVLPFPLFHSRRDDSSWPAESKFQRDLRGNLPSSSSG